jgi:outer membrane protein TolC
MRVGFLHRYHGTALAAWALLAGHLCQAQAPSGQSNSQPARAQQVPLSGRQGADTVVTQQSAIGGGTTPDANTINTSISAQGTYRSSVLDPQAAGAPIVLTLRDALSRALRFNLGSINASNTLRQVRAQRLAALSALLPNLSGSLSYTDQKTDLQSIGLSASTVPGLGANLPKVVGPYHFYDARGSASQTLFDQTALNNYRESKALEQASELSQKDARELVLLAVSGEYLSNISEIALVRSQEAQVQYSQASYNQALAQNHAGTKSRVDTQRSLVQLQTEQQRLSSDTADLAKEELTLVRMLGRVRSLRGRRSSQWRMAQVPAKTIRAEWIQTALAILTLGLVVVEWGIHLHLHGSI